MATREQIRTALLTEHLRYTPLTLLDDIINTVNELVYQAVNNIETALLSVPPDHLGFVSFPAPSISINAPSAPAETVATATEEEKEEATESAARAEIEGGIVKLESLLNATIDKDFDKLEIYTLRNLLTVSNAKEDEGLEDWIMLDHYKNLQIHADQQSQKAANAPTPESLSLLRRKLAETERLQSLLRAENARNTALLSQLRPLLSPATTSSQSTNIKAEEGHAEGDAMNQQPSFAFLTAAPEAKALGLATTNPGRKSTMAQNASFTYSQVSSLRDMLQSLRPHLASLSTSPAVMAATKEEEERHAYIEGQSRKAMERAGIETSTSEVGIALESLGRRVGAEEVRALEGVLGAFEAGATERRRDKEDNDKMEE